MDALVDDEVRADSVRRAKTDRVRRTKSPSLSKDNEVGPAERIAKNSTARRKTPTRSSSSKSPQKKSSRKSSTDGNAAPIEDDFQFSVPSEYSASKQSAGQSSSDMSTVTLDVGPHAQLRSPWSPSSSVTPSPPSRNGAELHDLGPAESRAESSPVPSAGDRQVKKPLKSQSIGGEFLASYPLEEDGEEGEGLVIQVPSGYGGSFKEGRSPSPSNAAVLGGHVPGFSPRSPSPSPPARSPGGRLTDSSNECGSPSVPSSTFRRSRYRSVSLSHQGAAATAIAASVADPGQSGAARSPGAATRGNKEVDSPRGDSGGLSGLCASAAPSGSAGTAALSSRHSASPVAPARRPVSPLGGRSARRADGAGEAVFGATPTRARYTGPSFTPGGADSLPAGPSGGTAAAAGARERSPVRAGFAKEGVGAQGAGYAAGGVDRGKGASPVPLISPVRNKGWDVDLLSPTGEATAPVIPAAGGPMNGDRRGGEGAGATGGNTAGAAGGGGARGGSPAGKLGAMSPLRGTAVAHEEGEALIAATAPPALWGHHGRAGGSHAQSLAVNHHFQQHLVGGARSPVNHLLLSPTVKSALEEELGVVAESQWESSSQEPSFRESEGAGSPTFSGLKAAAAKAGWKGEGSRSTGGGGGGGRLPGGWPGGAAQGRRGTSMVPGNLLVLQTGEEEEEGDGEEQAGGFLNSPNLHFSAPAELSPRPMPKRTAKPPLVATGRSRTKVSDAARVVEEGASGEEGGEGDREDEGGQSSAHPLGSREEAGGPSEGQEERWQQEAAAEVEEQRGGWEQPQAQGRKEEGWGVPSGGVSSAQQQQNAEQQHHQQQQQTAMQQQQQQIAAQQQQQVLPLNHSGQLQAHSEQLPPPHPRLAASAHATPTDTPGHHEGGSASEGRREGAIPASKSTGSAFLWQKLSQSAPFLWGASPAGKGAPRSSEGIPVAAEEGQEGETDAQERGKAEGESKSGGMELGKGRSKSSRSMRKTVTPNRLSKGLFGATLGRKETSESHYTGSSHSAEVSMESSGSSKSMRSSASFRGLGSTLAAPIAQCVGMPRGGRSGRKGRKGGMQVDSPEDSPPNSPGKATAAAGGREAGGGGGGREQGGQAGAGDHDVGGSEEARMAQPASLAGLLDAAPEASFRDAASDTEVALASPGTSAGGGAHSEPSSAQKGSPDAASAVQLHVRQDGGGGEAAGGLGEAEEEEEGGGEVFATPRLQLPEEESPRSGGKTPSGRSSGKKLFGRQKKSARAVSMTNVELDPSLSATTGEGGAAGGEGEGAGAAADGAQEKGPAEKKAGHRSTLSLMLSPGSFNQRNVAFRTFSARHRAEGGVPATESTEDGLPDRRGLLEEGLGDVRKKYDVKEKIGEGRPGVVVYECVQRGSGKRCACKSIDKATLNGPKKEEAMRLEVALLRQLAGIPNIVGMEDVVEDEQHIHIIMEMCGGGDLLNHVNSAPHVSEQQAATVLRQLAEAVHACHERGVIHRDLKPENVLLAAPGSWWDVRVADFGISAILGPGEMIQGYAGSPFYIAPEVLCGPYSFEADVWSLGVIFYVLLSQRLPFWHSSDAGVYKLILKGSFDTRTGPWVNISREARSLVHRLLEMDPLHRITLPELLADPWVVANQCSPPSRPSSNASVPPEASFKLSRRRRSIARSSANIISAFRLPFCLTPMDARTTEFSDEEDEEEEQEAPQRTATVPHVVVTDDPKASAHIHVRGLSFGGQESLQLVSPAATPPRG